MTGMVLLLMVGALWLAYANGANDFLPPTVAEVAKTSGQGP